MNYLPQKNPLLEESLIIITSKQRESTQQMSITHKDLTLKTCIGIFLVVAIIACHPKNQSELYGTYIADYDIAKEKLILNTDGSFIQEVTLKQTSKVDVAMGSWDYYSKTGHVTFDNNFMIVLKEFGKFNPDYAQPRNKGLVIEPAEKFLGNITLGSDEGVLYRKRRG